MKVFQTQLALKDPQAGRLSNPEVATKHLVRTGRPFFKQRPNCSRKVTRQRLSGPGIVKPIPLFHGERVATTSSLSVKRALLGHTSTQVRRGCLYLSAL
jgi:hypothetical protein